MNWQGLTIAKQPLAYSWTPTDGYNFITPYRGTTESCRSLSQIFKANRIPHSFQQDGPTAVIEPEIALPDDGAAEVAHGSWALLGNPETVDWRQHPKYLALTKYEKWNIEQYLKEGLETHPDDYIWTYSNVVYAEDGSIVSGSSIVITPSDDAKFFLQMAYQGQQSYTRTARVLRHNLLVSQAWEAALSNGNADRVYTTAQVIAEGSQYADPIPGLITAEMDILPSPASTPTGYIWGWLKQAPVIQTVAGYKVECSVEYALELWPTIFYPAKS